MGVTEKQVRFDGLAIDCDWLALPMNASDLYKRVRETDWHFFWLAEEVVGVGIGTSMQSAAKAALRRCLRRIKAARNLAQVIAVRHRLLFGLHYCEIRLAARHIQFGPILNLTPSVGLVSPTLMLTRSSGSPECSSEAIA